MNGPAPWSSPASGSTGPVSGSGWDHTGVATSTLVDGPWVSLITDFGEARSSRDGVLRLRQATPAGVWHTIVFGLERRGDGASCKLVVRG